MANEGKRADVEKQIAEHQPRIRSFIRRRVASTEDAEDILQDVFYKFVRTVETTLNPIERVSDWLFRVARNTIINNYKKKREVPFPEDATNDDDLLEDFKELLFSVADESDNPENVYLRSLVWQELEKALSELPPEQREIFELTEIEGIPVKEISAAGGVPVNTLLSRKHYAIKYLRRRLAALYKEFVVETGAD